MKVNSLEASAAGKNKTKDIHLPSIDVTFGSNRILCVLIARRLLFMSHETYRSGASLTLAYGRRYGLIGRNGKFFQINFTRDSTDHILKVWVNPLYCGILLYEKSLYRRTSQFFLWNKRYVG